MTLTGLLEIERGLLTDSDELGLRFAEALWISEGHPVKGNELCRTIEKILRTCEREGVHYPAILLRRKKELERGTWKPRLARPVLQARPALSAYPAVSARAAAPPIVAAEAVAAVPAAAGIPAPQNVRGRIAGQVAAQPQVAVSPQVTAASLNSSQAVRSCKVCGGSGIVRSADGQTGRACECFLRWRGLIPA